MDMDLDSEDTVLDVEDAVLLVSNAIIPHWLMLAPFKLDVVQFTQMNVEHNF
jgi:hypothetical protein